MNSLLLSISACCLATLSLAQNDTVLIHGRKTVPAPSYCAVLKDGVTVVLNDDKPIQADVVLSNGTRISPDGALVKKDGNRSELKLGECISPAGEVLSLSQATSENPKKNKPE